MKILIAIGSRANYSSIKSFINACHLNKDINLLIVCFASAVLEEYGNIADMIEIDGYPVKYKLSNLLAGNKPTDMSKSTGLALIDITSVLVNENPDYCVTVGDRFETIATAIASSYSNIRVIHTMGGELSGSIDESIRHAVTKLSHLHFTATEDARLRVIRLGEDPKYVLNVGCPRLDLVKSIIKNPLDAIDIRELEDLGVGSKLDFEKEFAIISMHPVTTSDSILDIRPLIMNVLEHGLQIVCLWPNADSGSAIISKSIRKLRESGYVNQERIKFYKNLPVSIYIKLMNKCSVLIGNSSSGIREGAFIGTPCINIGTRQESRERGPNVIDIPKYEKKRFSKILIEQLNHRKYAQSYLYGNGNACDKMIDAIMLCKPAIQKKFIE